MKNVVPAIVALIIGIAIGYAAFHKEDVPPPKKVDATSHATPQKKKGEVTLPPKGETYEILGVIDGLQKFAVKYDDNFLRGGQVTSIEGGEAFKKLGVKTVISITPTDLERLVCEKYGIKLVEIPYEKTTLTADILTKFVDEYNKAAKPVYVHCHGGTHRGGLLGYVYRTKVLGWDNEKAKKEYDTLGGDPDNTDTKMFTVAKEFAGK